MQSEMQLPWHVISVPRGCGLQPQLLRMFDRVRGRRRRPGQGGTEGGSGFCDVDSDATVLGRRLEAQRRLGAQSSLLPPPHHRRVRPHSGGKQRHPRRLDPRPDLPITT